MDKHIGELVQAERLVRALVLVEDVVDLAEVLLRRGELALHVLSKRSEAVSACLLQSVAWSVTYSHHLLELALVNLAILVLVATLDKLQQMVDEVRLNRRAVSQGVHSTERSAEHSQVRVDLERVLVVLVREEGCDTLRERVHR